MPEDCVGKVHVDDVRHHVKGVGVEKEPEEASNDFEDIRFCVVGEDSKIKCYQSQKHIPSQVL